MTSDDFIQWLIDELNERDWSMNELARRAGVTSGAISLVMSMQRKPGPELLLGIAQALQLPPETVFRKAGIFPDNVDLEPSMTRQRADFLFSHLTLDEQAAVIALMERLAEDRLRKANNHGRVGSTVTEPT